MIKSYYDNRNIIKGTNLSSFNHDSISHSSANLMNIPKVFVLISSLPWYFNCIFSWHLIKYTIASKNKKIKKVNIFFLKLWNFRRANNNSCHSSEVRILSFQISKSPRNRESPRSHPMRSNHRLHSRWIIRILDFRPCLIDPSSVLCNPRLFGFFSRFMIDSQR